MIETEVENEVGSGPHCFLSQLRGCLELKK